MALQLATDLSRAWSDGAAHFWEGFGVAVVVRYGSLCSCHDSRSIS